MPDNGRRNIPVPSSVGPGPDEAQGVLLRVNLGIIHRKHSRRSETRFQDKSEDGAWVRIIHGVMRRCRA